MGSLFNAWLPADPAGSWVLVMSGALVKGAILLALVGVLAFLLRRAAAATRHLLWTLGIGGILVLPLLAGVLPSWRLETPAEIPLPVGALRFVPPAEMVAPGQVPVVPGRPNHQPVAAAEAGDAGYVDERGPGADPRPMAETATANPASAAAVDLSPATILFWIWLAGVAAVLGGLAAGSLRLRKVVSEARPPSAEESGGLVAEIESRLGIDRPVRVIIGEVAVSPQTWGIGRPTVLLPAAWREWNEEKRRQVLVHELAHIRRGDCLTQTVAHLACAFYWCNPLVWFAAHRMRVERERACDDHVLTSGEAASSYADNLLEIASTIGRHGRPAFGEVPMARSSQMSGRLLAVLDATRRRQAPGRTAVIAIGLLLVLTAAPLAAIQTADSGAGWGGGRSDDAGPPAEIDLADFEKAWSSLGDRMIEAARERDSEMLAQCYTRDARLFAPGRRNLDGRGEVEEKAASFWQVPVDEYEIVDTEFYQVGRMVCSTGRVRAYDKDGDVLGTNRFMSLYRWEQGRWRIHRDIVNN